MPDGPDRAFLLRENKRIGKPAEWQKSRMVTGPPAIAEPLHKARSGR